MILTMPYKSIDNTSTKTKYSIENTYHYVTDLTKKVNYPLKVKLLSIKPP